MKESQVLIIANEPLNSQKQIGVFEKEFDHLEKTHADIYKDFCREYCPELEELVSYDMVIGKDCALIFSKLGHMSYIRFDSYLELFIPIPEKLSSLQKEWLRENYHALNERYDMDIWILVQRDKYYMMKQYEAEEVKKGVIEELQDIVVEREEKRVGK